MFDVDVDTARDAAREPRVVSAPVPPYVALPRRRSAHRVRRRYTPRVPRAALAILSIAMVALTMGTFVVLPALHV
jgi:hypothetical protein